LGEQRSRSFATSPDRQVKARSSHMPLFSGFIGRLYGPIWAPGWNLGSLFQMLFCYIGVEFMPAFIIKTNVASYFLSTLK
jgi:hypothetical protein